jgi:hypothetical protein
MVTTGRGDFAFTDLKLTVSGSDLSGEVTLDTASEPVAVTADLSSRYLDMRPVLAQWEGPGARAGTSDRHRGEDCRVFSRTPLPLDAVGGLNVDVTLRAGEMLLPWLSAGDVNLHAWCRNGHLIVDRLTAAVAGGRLEGGLDLCARDSTATVTVRMKCDGCRARRIITALGGPPVLQGVVEADIDLSGRGKSIAGLMAHLEGTSVVIVKRGRVAQAGIQMIAGGYSSSIGRLINPFSGESSHTRVNCFVGGFIIRNGIAETTALVMDTDSMSVVGDGRINLRNEALDLYLRPFPKGGLGSEGTGRVTLSLSGFSKPLKITGTLSRPVLTVDPTKSALVVGKVVGSMMLFGPAGVAVACIQRGSDGEDLCLAAVEAARKGHKLTAGGSSTGTTAAVQRYTESVKDGCSNAAGAVGKVLRGVKNGVRGAGERLKDLFGR